MSARVLFVALSVFDRRGGLQRFNQRLVRALAGSPAVERCAVVSLTDREQRPLGPRAEFVACAGSRARLVREVVRRLRRERPQLLLLGHLNLLPLAGLSRALARDVRRALCVHGFEAWGDPRWRPARRHERWLLRHDVDALIAVSRHTADRVARAFGAGRVPRFVLPNAIDLEPGWEPPVRSEDASRPPRLLSVTKLDATEWDKGIARVIEAVARLAGEFPGLRYEVVGGGALVERLRRLAAERGVADRVEFAGGVDEAALDAAYRRADVFVLPSKKEGFGIVFLEAWKHGLPVVCGDGDASPEVVREGGLAVDPDDPTALESALAGLLRDPALRRKLAARGFEQLRSEYRHEHFATRVGEIVSTLAGAPA